MYFRGGGDVFRPKQYDACIETDDKRWRLVCFNGTDKYWSEQAALTVVYSVSSVQDKTQRFGLVIKPNISITKGKYAYISGNKSLVWGSDRFTPRFYWTVPTVAQYNEERNTYLSVTWIEPGPVVVHQVQ
jgi:hypothetical protein